MKNKFINFFILFSIFLIGILIVAFSLIGYVGDLSTNQKIQISIIICLMAFLDIAVLIVSAFFIRRKREDIRRSFDYYIEEQISKTGAGVIIFNNDYDIIWASKFLENRMGRSIIGRKLHAISQEFANKYEDGQKNFKFEIKGVIYDASINVESRTLILKDITNESMLLNQYVNEKTVIGELEIDNFQQFQVTLSEEELFKIQSNIIKMLDNLTEEYNLVYWQYVNGKYIFLTNEETLNQLVERRFKFLDQIRMQKIGDGINLTASLGVGAGTRAKKDLNELARDGLRLSQSRGGDQVTLMIFNKRPQYFGSKVEIAKLLSRVKIKQIAQLFEEKIKLPNIKNIVIYGHAFADLDAVGAALGVAEIAHSFGKEVVIGNTTFDSTTEKTLKNFMARDELSIFVRANKAQQLTSNNTIVVIVDTPNLSRTENKEILRKVNPENLFIFDHHRTGEKIPTVIPKNNIYVDTSSSSTAEIITELIEFITTKITMKKTAAQMMLNGIYLDTKNFTKSTSSRTFQAAAHLESRGAESAIAAEILKIPAEFTKIVQSMLSHVEEIKPGYFIASHEGEVNQDVVSLVADEILRTQNRKAAFVIAKIPGKSSFKMSARGIETNVQKIAEAVGGGGHFGAAAAVSRESLSIFVDNIRQAIVSKKGDQ